MQPLKEQMTQQETRLLAYEPKLAEPSGDLFTERNSEAVSGHAAKRHLCVLQPLHQLRRFARLQHGIKTNSIVN